MLTSYNGWPVLKHYYLTKQPNWSTIIMDTILTDIFPLARDIDDAIDEVEEQIY